MTQAPQAPRAGPARPGRPWRAGLLPLRSALGLFTILPVKAAPEIGRDEAARAVLWLPVAGATTARARIATGAALLAVTAATAAAAWGWHPAVRGVVAVLAGVCAGDLLRRLARRRLGGMTGDVFGALVELTTATVLLILA